MPDKKQVRAAIERHVAYWNAGQRGDWIANFSEDVVLNDPVGSPPKHGREAALASWDNFFTDGQAWTLELTSLVVCADEAAITLNNHGQVAIRISLCRASRYGRSTATDWCVKCVPISNPPRI